MLYLVPPLSVVKASNLPRVQVAPIAWKSISHLPTRAVSAWSAGIPGNLGTCVSQYWPEEFSRVLILL